MLDHSSVNSMPTPGKLPNLPVWSYLLKDTGMSESAVNNEDIFKGTFVEGQILSKNETG